MPKRKAFYISYTLVIIYLFLGFLFIGMNDFSLTKAVSRRPFNPDCAISAEAHGLLGDITDGCFDTLDYRTSHHATWVSWQFFSDERGSDAARYLPADILVLGGVGLGLFLLNKKRLGNK